MDIESEGLWHFKNLLKIDTSNPPGREIHALNYLKEVLHKDGLEPIIHETAPERGNLIVRIKGNGEKKPLLISSHVDVVHSEPDKWKYPPFSAQEADGCIYGRGAIDMKNFTAMCLMAVLNAKREKWKIKRDIIMTAVSDEETGSHFGMSRLVKERPELIQAEYGLGEVGAATHYIGDKPFYPIQCGEKGVLWIRVKFKGSPGHGSLPRPENVHWQIGKFLNNLEQKAMPPHMTNTFNAFIDGLIELVGYPAALQFQALRTPFAAKILKKRIQKNTKNAGRTASMLTMLTNTVNPTGLTSGYQHNVVPSVCTLNLDCRVIPGVQPEQVIREVEMLTGQKLEYEIVNSQAGHETPIDTPLFQNMKSQIESSHPGAKAIPMLTMGFTDAAQLQKLGIKCYGYTPIKLPPEISFAELYHGHNERIPIDGFKWGLNVFLKTIKSFCEQ